ncbi:beta-1,4-galactosyltransferase 2 isoform X2 [Austrofundulus limnaeus]|uniref:Beta-1,4-galactosyltransferase n=1 Tax=Austrofundulus limnaeus TaxID=52670 RepID=A0A2I4CSP2_AUSLI|nr:PREDICTED: beta-1,4-galactosyltransferase 2-like isoform X2 [Austrofundulus limnaeus]
MLRKSFRFLAFYSVLSLTCLAVFIFFHRKTSLGSQTDKERQLSVNMSEPLQNPGTSEVNQTSASGPCPNTPPDLLGPLHVEFETNRTLDEVREQVGSALQLGGRYKPPNCVSKQKVAIIIPFRYRDEHLNHWLYYLHPILMRQQVDYSIYVINQYGHGVFNKAKLMNAGYAEALKEYDYDCFVFSDVDMVPLDDRNLYRCFDSPRHLAVGVDKFNFTLPYKNIFGGVIALSKEQFLKINGFSNTYWGWGGEDDDISNRVRIRIKSISRPDSLIGRYKMIHHDRDLHNDVNPHNPYKLHETIKTFKRDGLNSLNYTVKDIKRDKLFTFISVDVHVPSGLNLK